MAERRSIAEVMPAMLRHAGVWEGTYRHVDLDGVTVDQHQSRVECLFPENGEFDYVQRNRFTWDDGKEYEVEFGGVVRGDRLYWDTPTFSGYGWASIDDIVLLTLQRKDVANASFTEIIVLGERGDNRARTWHWFQDGELLKRTLCNERLVTTAAG